MQEGQNARQQVVERIRQSTSILVAVGSNPSVDALAAALGVALMLNKMGKHATAVFSGQIPPAIQFLEPAKTFESNVDALRDFIISLDKEKADRLRYKVEDDVVRIFITPYKTSITEKDLQYSQGDFNVDLIMALGVEKRDDLDKAIVSHGRILHDATVITVNMNNQHSSLGALDWNDNAASSLCEMLVGLSEALQHPGILDAQISTALLTGVVAATDRFSNKYTTPRVMTMAAQLMAAGANQQLIATNLEQAHAIAAKPQPGALAKQEASTASAPMQEEKPKKEPGELDIAHAVKPAEPKPAPAEKPASSPQVKAEADLEAALPTSQVSHALLPDLQKDLEEAVRKADDQSGLEPEAPGGQSVNAADAVEEPKIIKDEDYLSHGSWKGKRLEPPTLGGTLNATTEEAHEDSEKADEDDRNKTLLNHPGEQAAQAPRKKQRHDRDRRESNKQSEAPVPTIGIAPVEPPVTQSPVASPVAAIEPSVPSLPPEPAPQVDAAPPTAPVIPEPTPAPVAAPEPTPAPQPVPELDLAALQNEAATAVQAAVGSGQPPAPEPAHEVDTARQAVSSAFDNQPFDPANHPLTAVGAQPVPSMPDMPVSEPLTPEALQALPSTPSPVPAPSPSDLPPLPPMPPMPTNDMALPPAPTVPLLPAPAPESTSPPPSTMDNVPPAPDLPGLNAPTPSNDPGQFKIPGA